LLAWLATTVLRGSSQVVFENKVDQSLKNRAGRRRPAIRPELQRVFVHPKLATKLICVSRDLDRTLD